MARRLIIKGAQYFDGESILIPHFTGEFYIVDYTEYVTKDVLKQRYNSHFIKENKDNYIEHEGEKYFYAEYSPFNVSDSWELLNDVSNLYFQD